MNLQSSLGGIMTVSTAALPARSSAFVSVCAGADVTKPVFDDKRQNVSITTIKMLCDGLDMTLGEFFSTPEFEELEQEIK